MRKLQHHHCRQQDLFSVSETQSMMSRFVSAYRITLVRDERVRFRAQSLDNPSDARRCLQDLIRDMARLTGNSSVC